MFWARMECGLVLSSVSPWEIVDKKKGETRGGYVCRHCRGFWRSGRGASRFLLLIGEHREKILGEPPQQLYEAWGKDRIETVKGPLLPGEPQPRFGPDLVGGPLNPKKDGLKKIHDIVVPGLASLSGSQLPLALRGYPTPSLPAFVLLCQVPLALSGGEPPAQATG